MSPAGGAEAAATIVVRRAEWSWTQGRDAFRSYVVTVNGQRAGKVRRGESLELPVPAGRHTVRAKIDWTGSPDTSVDIDAGERVVLNVQPTGNAFRFDQMFQNSTYLSLERVGDS